MPYSRAVGPDLTTQGLVDLQDRWRQASRVNRSRRPEQVSRWEKVVRVMAALATAVTLGWLVKQGFDRDNQNLRQDNQRPVSVQTGLTPKQYQDMQKAKEESGPEVVSADALEDLRGGVDNK